MSIFSKSKRDRSIRKQEESCNQYAEALNKAIWPATNVDEFLRLLEETGTVCFNLRHGSRHDTCLHRYDINAVVKCPYQDNNFQINNIRKIRNYLFEQSGPADSGKRKLSISYWRKELW